MIEEFFAELWIQLKALAPSVITSIIILVIGWIAGRFAGKAVSKIMQRVGLRSALERTAVARVIERSKLTVTDFFDLIVRWLIYMAAILAAIDNLQIKALTSFTYAILAYLPHFVAGVIILIVGLIISDFMGDAVKAIGTEANIEYSPLISAAVRFFLYFVALILGLSAMKVDVFILQIIAIAIAVTVAIGVGGAIAIAFGFGLRDFVSENAPKWFDAKKKTAKQEQ